mgnify:CR=1 FL=1
MKPSAAGVISGLTPSTVTGRYANELTITGSNLVSGSGTDVTEVQVCGVSYSGADIVSEQSDSVVVDVSLEATTDTCEVKLFTVSRGQPSFVLNVEIRACCS